MPYEWIKVDEKQYDSPPKEIKRSGVVFEVFISPYDLPEAVRGSYDDQRKRFVIEFRYIQDEPKEKVVGGQFVTFEVGKHSKRLYHIEVDVDKLRVNTVALQLVDKAIDHLGVQLSHTQDLPPNFQVAKRVLHDNVSKLTNPLPHVP